tara:strand:+ start:2648 stop:2965 length:318 start_codon:yes stop_codon:yes gene_type:complete
MKKFLALTILFLNMQLISDDYIIIDVRTPEEYKSGYIKNAINIEWQDIETITSNILKDQKIYLYCRSGNRSGKAEEILKSFGYTNTINIGGLVDASNYLNAKIIK